MLMHRITDNDLLAAGRKPNTAKSRFSAARTLARTG
jgi:hypothetical protein